MNTIFAFFCRSRHNQHIQDELIQEEPIGDEFTAAALFRQLENIYIYQKMRCILLCVVFYYALYYIIIIIRNVVL